jgi:hypothetical protein
MTFPTETNGLASVTSGQSLAAGGHSARHNEVKAAIESIRDVLGGGSLTPGTGINVTSAGNVGIGTSSPPSISGYTTLVINNPTNGAIISLMQNGAEQSRMIGTGSTIQTSVNLPGTGLVERQRINQNGLITGSGTSLGAWTAYTPTLGGTGWALGNGTAVGIYCQIGKVVQLKIQVQFGSTSTYGVSPNALTLTVPVTASGSGGPTSTVTQSATLLDQGVGYFQGGTRFANLNAIEMRYAFVSGTNITWVPISNVAPFTWTTNDQISINLTYEAA